METMSVPYGPILIVEDIPNILDLLTVTLKYKGYPVVTARNGDEALARIDEERPSLILTDILMPKLDGFALAHQLRRDAKTHDIPIIFISATYIDPADKAFALSLGAVRFLEKPIEAEELLLTVAEVLTNDPEAFSDPLADEAFYRGYSGRLDAKLKEKRQQVARAQHLIEIVPPEQRPAFEALLDQTEAQRDEIEQELRALQDLLGEASSPDTS